MTNCVLRAPVQFRQRRLKFAIGPERPLQRDGITSEIGGKADVGKARPK
jgi:hypothetical protein